MKTKDNQRLLRKKRRNQIKVLFATIIVVLCICYGQYWVFIVGVILFLLNDIFKSDHVFYNPSEDYYYDLEPDALLNIQLPASKKVTLSLDKQMNKEGFQNTWLLSVELISGISAKFYDPFVEVVTQSYTNKQYFEKGVNGQRYINLTAAVQAYFNNHQDSASCDITLSFSGCSVKEQACKFLGFSCPDLTKKKVLIIAPHADDAEIAAFGLYSQADTHIITLTAGEIHAEPFQHVYSDIEKASILKGRLRAWDSIAVPLWGGVPQDKCINLGYFCMTLKAMYDNPDQSVSSLQAGINDTRCFREFNHQVLPSDVHGKATWHAMIDDLKTLIAQIKPEVIVMNDRYMDPHEDHIYAHIAVKQVLEDIKFKPEYLLYYANHYKHTNRHPFGSEHNIASLAPHFGESTSSKKLYSLTLSKCMQKNKVYALEMMHDLKFKKRWKKKRREWLQSIFMRRSINRYGDNEYFCKAIKENEIFFVETID